MLSPVRGEKSWSFIYTHCPLWGTHIDWTEREEKWPITASISGMLFTEEFLGSPMVRLESFHQICTR
jgi:hypothetical protein